jgi:hypothetical protein
VIGRFDGLRMLLVAVTAPEDRDAIGSTAKTGRASAVEMGSCRGRRAGLARNTTPRL